jgi:hypothetical protein
VQSVGHVLGQGGADGAAHLSELEFTHHVDLRESRGV